MATTPAPMPGPGPRPGPGPGPRPGPRPNPFPYFPQQRYVIVTTPRYCTPVYNNQAQIDGLNKILEGCKTAPNGICNSPFIKNVQNELANQLSKAVLIGQNCNTVNTTPTYIGGQIVY